MSDKEALELKKEILDLRLTHIKYIIPISVKKDKNKKHSIKIKCPYCKCNMVIENCKLFSIFYFMERVYCKNCSMSFFAVSHLYKLNLKYYYELDFLKKIYFYISYNILKRQS